MGVVTHERALQGPGGTVRAARTGWQLLHPHAPQRETPELCRWAAPSTGARGENGAQKPLVLCTVTHSLLCFGPVRSGPVRPRLGGKQGALQLRG